MFFSIAVSGVAMELNPHINKIKMSESNKALNVLIDVGVGHVVTAFTFSWFIAAHIR